MTIEKLCKGHDSVTFTLNGSGETTMPTQLLWSLIEEAIQHGPTPCVECECRNTEDCPTAYAAYRNGDDEEGWNTPREMKFCSEGRRMEK